MKQIKWIYGVLFGALTVLWLLAEQPWARSYDFFKLRAVVVDYTGFIAMGAMSLAMILAIRPVRLEPWLGGLDKSYRLHKWLGITALATGAVHWLWATGAKWAVGWGWLVKPERGPRPVVDESIQLSLWESLEHHVRGMRKIAEFLGEWTFYIAAVLIALALIKRFPYRYFFHTHRIIAVAYLVLVFHSVYLIKFAHWTSLSPIAWVSLLLMVGGTVGAVLSLTRQIGHQRRALGVVETLKHSASDEVMEVHVRLPKDRWDGHDAGQFAFVSFYGNNGGEAHPFTISSAWKNDGLLRFHVKNLGDHTSRLPKTLKEGDRAKVEGPYGCFRFESDKPRQIWVAGGIGITPFLARMEEFAHHAPSKVAVDLFYCVKNPDEVFVENLTQLAKAAGTTLHVLVDGRDPLLNAEKLCVEVLEWRDASLWFCGPSGFGQALLKGLVSHGFEAKYFHQELFEMR
ncbi:MAG: ferric reductase-like transmembrane domain-containing protein [Betaproteobacteria bacterium]|nr:ferric reductase-like transmembrane domain-containing protein [Betaproteobacteria bacterium]